MAEKARSYEYDDVRTGEPVTVYTTGKVQDVTKFDDAIKEWGRTGLDPQGFIVLKKSFAKTARDIFEGAYSPIESAVKAVESIPNIQGYNPNETDPSKQSFIGGSIDLVKKIPGAIASTVDQPGKVGALAGTGIAAGLTGGMTPLLQAILVGLGGAGGYAAGEGATGGNVTTGDLTREFILGTASSGLMSTLHAMRSKGVTELAKSNADASLKKLTMERFGPIANNPDALLATLSTKRGLQNFTATGIEGITGSVDEMALPVMQQINSALPGFAITKSTKTILNERIKDITTAVKKSLEKIDDIKVKEQSSKSIEDATASILSMVSKEFSNATPSQLQLMKDTAKNVIDNYVGSTAQLKDAARFIKILQDTGTEKGLNVQEVVTALTNMQGKKPGSTPYEMLQSLTGGSFTQQRDVYMPSILKSVLQHTPFAKYAPTHGTKIGTIYPGGVQGVSPKGRAIGTGISDVGIRSFLSEK